MPQKKAIHEIVRGLFTEHTPVLRHLAQNPKLTVKKQAEKYSYHLGNISLKKQIDTHAIRRVVTDITDDTIIAYDLTDIAKEYAQTMEKLSNIFDGSKRKVSPGFIIHGVGIHDMLIKFEIHDGSKHTLNQIRKRIIKEISAQCNKKGIWVFDRGNDHRSLFCYLRHHLKQRFVCRLKSNRHVVLKETGEKLAIEDITPGKYEVYLMNGHSTKVDTRGTYTLIIHNHLENKKPIRLLSNIKYATYSSRELVTIYLQRWGVESSFRRAKQKFQLERIRVLSYQKFENLVALIQFSVNLSRTLFITIQKATNVLVVGIIMLYKRYLRLKNCTFNTDSFISYIGTELCPLIRKKKPPLLQVSLFSRRVVEKLGSS